MSRSVKSEKVVFKLMWLAGWFILSFSISGYGYVYEPSLICLPGSIGYADWDLMD